jgi:hypothetical protein
MIDANPYESPKQPDPQSAPKPLARAPSATFIVVLTPLVSLLAGFLAFWAAIFTISAAGGAPGWHEGLLMLVFLGAAICAFAAMLVWAGRATSRAQKSE